MTETEVPRVVLLARRLAAHAQNGLYYADRGEDQVAYDVERWRDVQRIVAELLADGTGLAPGQVEAVLAQETGHATMKVDVRAVLRDDDGRYLLVREVSDGRWCLPGGWAEPNTSASEAAAREVREEAGRAVAVERLVGCFDRDRLPHGGAAYPFRVVKLYWLCRDLGAADRGGGTAAAETDGVAWFDLDDLPPLSDARTAAEHLRRVDAHLRGATGVPFD